MFRQLFRNTRQISRKALTRCMSTTNPQKPKLDTQVSTGTVMGIVGLSYITCLVLCPNGSDSMEAPYTSRWTTPAGKVRRWLHLKVCYPFSSDFDAMKKMVEKNNVGRLCTFLGCKAKTENGFTEEFWDAFTRAYCLCDENNTCNYVFKRFISENHEYIPDSAWLKLLNLKPKTNNHSYINNIIQCVPERLVTKKFVKDVWVKRIVSFYKNDHENLFSHSFYQIMIKSPLLCFLFQL